MNYRVLIVEDDPMVSMINSQFTRKVSGFEVAGVCRNGEEALSFLDKNVVDLILLDVFMPVMNGTEALKKIREKKIAAEVIMVTAADDTATIEETVHLGVHDYLIKPFTFERFKISLEKFVTKKMLLKENQKMNQSDIDNLMLNSVNESPRTDEKNVENKELQNEAFYKNLPKGIQQKTLEHIISYFENNSGWCSTDMIAQTLGISIVTVRNYMNYLVKIKLITEDINYSTGGRHCMLYKKAD
jgi:response regulator of citrate/malate metabolism